MKIVTQNMLKMFVSGVLTITLSKYWFWLLDDLQQYKIMKALKNRFNFRMKVYSAEDGRYVGDIEMESLDLSRFSLNEDFLSKHYMQVAVLKMGLCNYALVMPVKPTENLKPVSNSINDKTFDPDYFYPPGTDIKHVSENRTDIN